jgi:DNA-binding response OmpR family regulator
VTARAGKPVFSRTIGVLVVDDDVMVRTVATTLLRQMGAQAQGVGTSTDARDALARSAAAGTPIGVILLDLHLEGENGPDVCRRLRSEGVRAAIVAMSGDRFSPESLRNAGFDDGIVKPFSAAELHACVEHHSRLERERTPE